MRLVPVTGSLARRLVLYSRVAQPVGALAAIASFLLGSGALAGLLASAWFAVCLLAGLGGLAELVQARSLVPRHLLPAAALGFLTVAGGWMVAYRSGITFGYGPTVAELTSVHFHYAGFAATLMAALAHGQIGDRLSATAGLLVVFGTPITAAGFATGSPVLLIGGPILLATGVLTTAALTALVIAPRAAAPAPRWLLIVSAAGVVVPMLLGVDYAAARVLPLPALDIRTMAVVHGNLNAVVYALGGLAGWSLR